jgi:hypothetical protein
VASCSFGLTPLEFTNKKKLAAVDHLAKMAFLAAEHFASRRDSSVDIWQHVEELMVTI